MKMFLVYVINTLTYKRHTMTLMSKYDSVTLSSLIYSQAVAMGYENVCIKVGDLS